jgi:sulfatase maturation enzyme AslB (radical SAM superfamily)
VKDAALPIRPYTKEKIKKTVVFTGYRCNNRCVFCMEADKRDYPERDTHTVMRDILTARKSGSNYLEIIGGEATIRTDILRLVKFASAQGFKTVMMATNGRMMSYPEFAKKLVGAGVTDLVFSIHGSTAKIHDSLTNSPGSFDELMRGIANLRKLGFTRIGSNTAIVKPNYKCLPALGRLLLSQRIVNSEFIFADCNEGGVRSNYDKLGARISDAAPYMRALLDLGLRNGMNGWYVRYVPLCHFSQHLDCVSEINEQQSFITEHVAGDFVNRNVSASRVTAGRAKSPVCLKCVMNARCEGIWKHYAQVWGTKELRAVKKIPEQHKVSINNVQQKPA